MTLLKFIIFILMFLIFSCNTSETPLSIDSPAKKENTHISVATEKDTFMLGDKIFSISYITKSEYDSLNRSYLQCCGYETDYPGDSYDEDKVKKIGDSLVFKLSNSPEFILAGTVQGEECGYQEYSYSANLDFIDHWLVSNGSFENFNYILVNKANGELTELESFCTQPCFSPDKKYFICGSDRGNIAGVCAVYLFEINDKTLSLLASRILSLWGPTEFKWMNNTTILSRIILNENDQVKFIKLEMKN